MIQALFWDYDNTLFETEEAHWNKHRIVLAQHGIELRTDFRKRIYENNGEQNWGWIKNELGLHLSLSDYLKAIDCEFQKQMITIKMRPGIAEIFQIVAELQIPQAIITNARQKLAQSFLRQRNILSKMQFALFSEDYSEKKPNPAPYLLGLEKMRALVGQSLNPKNCLAIEDDPKGVQSAHQAGLTVIHRKLKREEIDSPYAHYSCFEESDFIKIMTNLIQLNRQSSELLP